MFSRGIVVLAVMASVLIVAFDASVTALIPLYAIGVFLSLTLSQAGMARRWRKAGGLAKGEERREPGSVLRHQKGWRVRMVINAVADRRQPNEVITIVVPQFVPRKRWHELLHAQTAVLLRLALLFRPGIVITNVPYRVGLEGEVH